MGSGDWLGPRRSWGMGRITRGPGGEVGSRAGACGRGLGRGLGGGGPLRQRREPGREEGPGGLPCGTPGDAAPWPGLVDPGGEAEPGRAGQAGDAALVARVARGCAAGPAGRRGGGAGPARSPPQRRGRGRAEHGGGDRDLGRDKGALGRKEDGVSMSRHSFQEDLVLVSGMGQTPHWASSTGDLAGAYIPTNPMADPVSLAWTFLLSVTPSTLALLTASLSSPQTTLLLPLHTARVPLLHVTSPAKDGRRSPGTQVPGTALLVTPLDGGAGVAQGRSDLRLGTSSLTSSHLLRSPATFWRTSVPKSLCFVHLLPSGGPVGTALRDEGQEGRAAHSPKHFLILFWINPRRFRLSHLWISSPPFHLRPRDERSRG